MDKMEMDIFDNGNFFDLQVLIDFSKIWQPKMLWCIGWFA